MSGMYSERSATIAAPPQRRRRPPLSCLQCRNRKIRCDQKRPCNQCERSKDITCVYTSSSGFDKKLRHTPTLERSFQIPTPDSLTSPASTPSSSRGSVHTACSPFTITNSLVSLPKAAVLPAPGFPVFDSPKPNLLPIRQYSPSTEPHVADIFSDGEKERQPCRFVGESHWLNHIMQFEKVVTCFFGSLYNKGPQHNAELRDLNYQSKALERILAPERPLACPTALSDIQNTIPSKEICDELVGHYFRTFESIYRIIHIPSFLKRYDQYWSHPEVDCNRCGPFVMQLLLALAIGSAFQPPSTETTSLRSAARQWVFIANSWLLPLDKSRMNISGIQIQCLLILARETIGVCSDFLWISAGALLRTAMQLGYHRDPKQYAGISILHGEMRRRLWATIVELTIRESLATAMPPMISMDNFDTEPPANINDTDIDQETVHRPKSQDSTTFTQSSVQIILLRSLRVRLELATICVNFRSQLSYDEVLQLHSDLTNAHRQAHSLNFISNNKSFTQLQHNHIDLVLLRPLITLHQPWAVKARTDPRYCFSRKVCLDTCLAMTSFPLSPDYSCLLTVGTGPWSEIGILPPFVIGLELIFQLEEEALNPPSAIQSARAKAARDPLIQAIRDNLILRKKRLHAYEVNIKDHLFNSMFLGQIEAVERGEDVEKGIVEAAIKTLREFIPILEEKASILQKKTIQIETPPSWENQNYGGDAFDYDTLLDGSQDFDMYNSGIEIDWDPWL